MMATETQCRAWVGSLAAYNAGHLVGAWIDLDGKDEDDVRTEAVEAMRPQIAGFMSEAQAFDELWCFDTEGISALVKGECNIAEAVRAAEKINAVGSDDDDRRNAWIAYLENGSGDDPSDFEDAYCGAWNSEQDYADDLIEDLEGLGAQRDSIAARYFDYQAFARDLFMGDYCSLPNPDGGVFVFRS